MSLDVMLSDDSPAIRKLVRRVLDISGLPIGRCHEASNGNDALATLGREHVDLVLTDINMPGMDGESFVRHLRANPAWVAMPVVVISTDSTSVRRQRLEELGVQGYLSKPFTPETLRAELERVLGPDATLPQQGADFDDPHAF